MSELTRVEKAVELFKSGYNCSQAVAIAFADKLEMDEKTIAKLTSGYGGGMGRLRETCGTISGAVFVVSSLYGYDDKDATTEKARLYEQITNIGEKFKSEFTTLKCGELLANIKTTIGSMPEARTAKYYKVRPCVHFVVKSTELVEELINQMESPKI